MSSIKKSAGFRMSNVSAPKVAAVMKAETVVQKGEKGEKGEKGDRGERGEKGEAASNHFWAGSIIGITEDNTFTFVPQTGANSLLFSMDGNDKLKLPNGTYLIQYHINMQTENNANFSVVVYDSNGPLEISRSNHVGHNGSVVKMFAVDNVISFHVEASSGGKVQNGSIFVLKL